MIVTYIILLIVAFFMMAGHLAKVEEVRKANEGVSPFFQRHIPEKDFIRFYVAIFVFALMVGLIVDRIWSI